MKKEELTQILESTFNKAFDDIQFQKFTKNLLKEYTTKNFKPTVKNEFVDYIKEYTELGEYIDSEKRRVSILKVLLSKDSSLIHARTAQRNFVAEYLKTRGLDAALVAFISPKENDWRFSLVKLEYSLLEKNGKIVSHETLTPAKRWSFLVGENEGSHTAQSRFLKLLEDERHPTLKELETAFDVEEVTDEFFEKYKELFFSFKESLEKELKKDIKLKQDFEKKDIDPSYFAKKTLGQIVFLYFLQKKGWFGVKAGEDWGSGSKNFVRQLFDDRKKFADYKGSFFNDILEPLFYKALSNPYKKGDIYDRINVGKQKYRIPFLNGGLFSPINDYSWENTNINIPDEIFANHNKTKQGDYGDGILDVFDRYNFTVNENEPLEKEVAVDPEMLGKVFENLLDIKERKDKGSFYTPREIVHYMCRESLINYLETETNNEIPREDIEFLIYQGNSIIENDSKAWEKTQRGKYQNSRYEIKTPKSIRGRAEDLDLLLSDIKVADPAVGSGAFPLGMINEIVSARRILGIFASNDDTVYDLKLRAISKSIHGVDIDPGAVEIAKLRLWLSLVVEEKEPHPLPNLDHRIMQGNSLLSEYEGIKPFDPSLLNKSQDKAVKIAKIEEEISVLQQSYIRLYQTNKLGAIEKKEIEQAIKGLEKEQRELKYGEEESVNNQSLFDSNPVYEVIREKTERFQQKIEQYVSENINKQALKLEIDNLKWEIIEDTLREQDKTTELKLIKKLRHDNIKPFFLWELEFIEVFKDKGGFDIVIGNPPYVSTKGRTATDKESLKKEFGFVDDLYSHFFFKGLSIGKENSVLAYITSKTFWTIQSKKNLRVYLQKLLILEIYDTASPFKAMVDTSVTIVKNMRREDDYILSFKDGKKDLYNPDQYYIDIKTFKEANNNVFFVPTEFNLQVYNKYNTVISKLVSDWWPKINTSTNIKNNALELNEYRQSLKPGDIVLLGTLTEGGQGLATANNGKYVAVLEGTKEADKVRVSRAEKLFKAEIKELGLRSKEEAKDFLRNKSEIEIRKLFDNIKKKYGRDIFGQGYLFRIVDTGEIADVSKLSDDEKKNGIKGEKSFVPYDKGDKDGNRWYLRTPYYIDWNNENVGFLKSHSGKKGKGMPVVRNPKFYFREGFCWSDIHTVLIKSRLKSNGVYDVKSMSMFTQYPRLPDWFFITLLNSTFISEYDFNFVNNTQTFQINDSRQLPVIIPSEDQLKVFKNIFDEAYNIKTQEFDGEISKEESEIKLGQVQERLDIKVYELYGLSYQKENG